MKDITKAKCKKHLIKLIFTEFRAPTQNPIGLNKVKTNAGTNYGQICTADKHPDKLF
jgi:hypothetical protein